MADSRVPAADTTDPPVLHVELTERASASMAANEAQAQRLEYRVQRPVFDYGTFGDTYQEVYRRKKSLLGIAKDEASAQCGCSKQQWNSRLIGLVPFVNMLRLGQYARADIVSDIAAGFTTCVFHIPQGLAYGMLAGLKPINGLYTSLIPVFIFAVFGRSRHLSIGTFSLMALLLSDMIEANFEAYLPRIGANSSLPMNYTATDYARLQTAIVGSFAASVILAAIGLLRLGFFMRYMSDAMLKGFTTAAAVQVVVSQLPLLLGVKPERTNSHFRIVASLINLSKVISSTNFVTLGLSAACCAVLYLVKEFVNPLVKKKAKVPLPIELIVIVITLLASKFADMNARFSVDIVGDVPRGLPSPLVPDLGFLPTVLPSAIPVGIVGGAITMSLAKLYCLQFQYSYDFNEDFVILGVSSLAGSFFQCFFACGALARNSVVVSVGMKSQLTNFISCLGMLLVLLAVGPFFETIPTCILGSIIVVSLVNVMRPVVELPHIFRVSRVEFAVFVVSGLAVLALDVTLGLAIGLAVALFSVVLRTQVPPTAELGRVGDTDIYEDLLVCPAARRLRGLTLLRFNAPLNFANAETFAEFVATAVVANGGGVPEDMDKGTSSNLADTLVHTVILDCSSWFYVDMVGVRTVKECCRLLLERPQGATRVLFAACKDPVRASFAKQSTTPDACLAASAFFVSLHDAALFAENAGPLPSLVVDTAEAAVVELSDDCGNDDNEGGGGGGGGLIVNAEAVAQDSDAES